MSANPDPRYERLLDLLADQALFGLDHQESRELLELLHQFPQIKSDEFELTAAAIHCAYQVEELGESDKLSVELQNKVTASIKTSSGSMTSNGHAANGSTATFDGAAATNGAAYKSATNGSVHANGKAHGDSSSVDGIAKQHLQSSLDISSSPTTQGTSNVGANTRSGSSERSGESATSPSVQLNRADRTREAIAWLTAVAAMIVAVIAWIDRGRPSGDVVTPQPVTLAELRQSLIDAEVDTHVISWTVNDAQFLSSDEEQFRGDVVWSDEAQEGYMSFEGLVANADSDNCYQLWIFDKDRDERYPVDGGVFTIRNDGEPTIVPINAKLRVDESTMFAITVEDNPGVVVSDRTRLPLLAVVNPVN